MPGALIDVKRVETGFLVLIDGVPRQECADIASVVAFINAILPPRRLPRCQSLGTDPKNHQAHTVPQSRSTNDQMTEA